MVYLLWNIRTYYLKLKGQPRLEKLAQLIPSLRDQQVFIVPNRGRKSKVFAGEGMAFG